MLSNRIKAVVWGIVSILLCQSSVSAVNKHFPVDFQNTVIKRKQSEQTRNYEIVLHLSATHFQPATQTSVRR